MNLLDRLVAYLSPSAAVKRKASRAVLSQYEGAQSTRMRNFRRDRLTQNELVYSSAVALRSQARFLARNHDIARGALRTIVNNIVGPHGIGVEPQPRRSDGTIHAEYAAQLMEAWRDWCRTPEVTHRMSWSRLQRSIIWARFRDGEVFGQIVQGLRPDLDHGTRVPLSLEMIEADYVPIDYEDPNRRIIQGIERNAWGRPTALHVQKTDPTYIGQPSNFKYDTKRIAWENVLHIVGIDHLNQIRGVSEFASVLTRMEDIKDYEESERIAAKIAAMLTAYVRKGTPDAYEATADGTPRQINFAPGMVIDDLGAGEEIGMIDSKRPNPNLITFRQGQLRAVAAGLGASYSSISKDYGGTYSSQRQELVEQWVNYAVMADDFVGQFIQPVWETFVAVASLSGVVRTPSDVVKGTENDAVYVAQEMPWIDPLKEAEGAAKMVESRFASEIEVIRRRGRNPHDVLEQLATFRKEAEGKGITVDPPQPDPNAAPPANPNAEFQSVVSGHIASLVAAQASNLKKESAPPSVTVNARIEQPDVNITNEVPQPHVTVEAPVVNVTNDVPAPVVNVTSPTPVVNVEAPVVNVTNDVQPADVNVNLPPRRTDSSVVRDEVGNIVSVTQIEQSI